MQTDQNAHITREMWQKQ